jgi:putative photosynthetic complex assembly protein 2
MLELGLAIVYTLFIWWFTTGLVLFLDGLPPRTFRWSMAGATTLLLGSVLGLVLSSAEATVAGAYIAFTCAILVWGWLEMAYFTGLLTGPRKMPCPPGCSLWTRFRLAVGTSLYHELAIIVTGSAWLVLSSGSSNRVGAWTFLILWGMRWSTKLNVFLGVRNLNEDWLPKHLRFMKTYFGHRPMNLLFPISVTVATVIAVMLVDSAQGAAGGFERVAFCLLATLMVLAILEHWFLVVPLPSEALWSWGMQSRKSQALSGISRGPGGAGSETGPRRDRHRRLGKADPATAPV